MISDDGGRIAGSVVYFATICLELSHILLHLSSFLLPSSGIQMFVRNSTLFNSVLKRKCHCTVRYPRPFGFCLVPMIICTENEHCTYYWKIQNSKYLIPYRPSILITAKSSSNRKTSLACYGEPSSKVAILHLVTIT